MTKSQPYKKRMLIVIYFNLLRSFFYIRVLQITAPGPNPAREAIHSACEAIHQTTERGLNPVRECIL